MSEAPSISPAFSRAGSVDQPGGESRSESSLAIGIVAIALAVLPAKAEAAAPPVTSGVAGAQETVLIVTAVLALAMLLLGRHFYVRFRQRKRKAGKATGLRSRAAAQRTGTDRRNLHLVRPKRR